MTTSRQQTELNAYVWQFIQDQRLASRVVAVMRKIPDEILRNLIEDPHFHLAIEDYRPGRGTKVWLALGDRPWTCSRSVVLRPRLIQCEEAFAHYVIAHEFAHAYLRNGGWGSIHDPEEAADALAATWGFPDTRR